MQIELTNLFSWAVLPASNAEELFNEPEVGDARRWTNTLDTEAQNEVLAALGERLPTLDAAKAAALLVLGGGLVENGADPNQLLPGGLAHLARLQQLHTDNPASGSDQTPADATWRFTVIGLMALLCRSAAARNRLRQQTQLLAWLADHEELSDHFSYLLHMAKLSDEDVVWVLFPAHETGLEISISQVNNTFHLLTLLQPLVLAHATQLHLNTRPAPTDPALLRFAQGDLSAPGEGSDYARWEWLNTHAYEGGPLNSAQLAWGDAAVSALPRLRGHVVLLAAELANQGNRSWDTGFLASMHDANRAEVRVRRLLPTAEVRSLLDELHPPVAAAPAAPPVAPLAAQPAPPAAPRSFWQRLRGK